VTLVVAVDHVFPDLEIERSVLGEVRDARDLDREQTLAACADADAILAGARFRFDADAIGRLEQCKAIVRYGIGVDNVDTDAATRARVWVACVPDYCVEEVADHALALVFALNRRLAELDGLVRESRWGIPPNLGVRRLSSCTLGIVGFGRIGETVGRRAAALGMRVLACDPVRPPAEIGAAGATPATLDELLAAADFVTLHAPPSSDGPIIGARELALLKESAVLVNVGRARLLDEDALIAALRAGALAGAGIDVPAREPLAPPHPLLELPNVLVTPHAAWYSLESIVELRTKAAEEAARVLRGERPRHPVNELSD
jgi:D-3-phosphoglycerate dehydrogenase